MSFYPITVNDWTMRESGFCQECLHISWYLSVPTFSPDRLLSLIDKIGEVSVLGLFILDFGEEEIWSQK